MNTMLNSCDFVAKNKGDDVYIYNINNSNPIFALPEKESSVETISFLKVEDEYTFIKENSNTNKAKEIFSFGKKMDSFAYLNLTSGVDFTEGDKYWYGIYCFSSEDSLSESFDAPFEWAFNNLCYRRTSLKDDYKYRGAVLFFFNS